MEQADIDFLISVVGTERLSTGESDLESHSQDESYHEARRPDVVVWAESAEEISAILHYANSRRIPVTPWSGGSSLEGNPLPVQGGILLALYNMNKILEIREEDLQVIVQPGIVYDELNKKLARYGLFFPPAPGSSDVATIGGMVANNSSGMHAVRYGATKDYVLKLQVVLPDGEIISTGCHAIKTASGYDLIHLFVGSEGTLGVITEVTLRLRIVPEKMAAVAVFPSMETAAQTIFDINRYGPAPAAIELMDPQIVSYVNRWKEMSLEEAPTLVMEFHGTPAGIQEEVTLIEETCRDNGCLRFDKGVTGSERDRLWAGRREAHNAVKYLNTDHIVEIGDIVMPISKYPAAVAKAYELAEELNVSIATFGHAGDGNLHIEILSRKGDPDDHARAEEFNERIVLYAISVGGTATGEHGVGIGKRKFMSQEHGASLEVMRRIKKLLDPNGIMNPGKIFLAEAVEA